MGEAFIVRKGGVTSDETAAPTITIVTESPTGVTFTVTNNDDNTALITHEIDDNIGGVELAAAATSSNITVALAVGTYTLSAFATVVGEVASQSSETVVIEVIIPAYEELFSTTIATAVTEIDITSLSIGKDDTLRMVYTIVGDATDTGQVSLFPNNLTTATNYYTQRLLGSGSSIIASRNNGNFIAFAGSTAKVSGFADVKVSNNDRFVCQAHFIRAIGANASGLLNEVNNIVGTQTVSSITSLKIRNSRTNGIAVGSKIALYKVTEAA